MHDSTSPAGCYVMLDGGVEASFIDASELSRARGGGEVKLPSYNDKAVCPKCNGTDIATRYEGPIQNDPCWYDRKYNPVGKWPEHEYMHRTCSRCKYDWPEAVKSASLASAGKGEA